MRDDDFKERVRSALKISDVVGTRVTWDRKKTNPGRGDFWAACPIHGEKSASFHCVDGKGFFHCFGCGATGDMFKFIMDLDGVDFPRALQTCASLAGIAMPDGAPLSEAEKRRQQEFAKQRERDRLKREKDEARDRDRRVNNVKTIWQETKPFLNSLAHDYFNWRGLSDPDDANLRFHPNLPHPNSGREHPALVARVQGKDGSGVGIWRIYLQPDGHGKLQGFDAKLGLGPTSGGAVRLGGIAKTIGLAEGVETARAVKELGTPYPVWAGLSTSGIIGFQIPEGVERVVVYPDRDRTKIKTRPDGRIADSPGLTAAAKFIENNPGRDIRVADGAEDQDYLEMLQAIKGLPVR